MGIDRLCCVLELIVWTFSKGSSYSFCLSFAPHVMYFMALASGVSKQCGATFRHGFSAVLLSRAITAVVERGSYFALSLMVPK